MVFENFYSKYCFKTFSETKKTTGKKTLIPFKEPEQEKENLEVFDEKFDYKDGLISAGRAISDFSKLRST